MQKELQMPIYLFHQGTAKRAYEFLGAHPCKVEGQDGYVFRLWAPEAKNVFLTGEFNNWDPVKTPMKKITEQGIWELFYPHLKQFDLYKYTVEDQFGKLHSKADPYGFHMETRPATASRVYDISGYFWNDGQWMARRAESSPYNKPLNIYEVHLGSWKRYHDGNFFDYHKLAAELIPYALEMNYTHIELMPICEYPFDGSWGYQVLGYYAPTSRYGEPKDFMAFIDACHQAGLGVILDWVPGHFPKNSEGLAQFDGSTCYEYSDPLKKSHEEWGTLIFDWGKNEVRSFLISNAVFWFDVYHVDGIRADAVASMLYLDYGRKDGEWRPNIKGGRENLEAVSFLQDLNKAVFEFFPNALMIAEESTAWPLVTSPVDSGGLGFNFKWNMGWMNDSLDYMKTDPYFRKGKHHALTFPLTYAFSENYILPLSHDEVVHGKGALLNKMPGSYEEKFAGLRAYYGYMMAHPGKKLLFMGGEFGQFAEWNYTQELDWMLLKYPMHKKMKDYVSDLNGLYLRSEALWELEKDWKGFQWLAADDSAMNIIAFSRIGIGGQELLIICNFAPVARIDYILPVENPARYDIIMDSNHGKYGGSGKGRKRVLIPKKQEETGRYSISLSLPPLSTLYYRRR
ncbi:1,4-alpha-glucan branching protein GlgB [Bacillota bacterium]